MATTTNYGWETPDDTDLVKDGAAAIRTLGNSVDTTTKNLNPETTLGDLAYRSATANVNTRLALGTANQVLRVNSGGTAPEWATTADQTPLTTKGDLFGFNTADARIPIGTNGHILTADSTEALGLKWAAPAAAVSGLTLIKKQTVGSGVTSQEVTSAFSATYDNYLITFTGGAAGTDNNDINITFGSTTSGYSYNGWYQSSTSATLNTFAGDSTASIGVGTMDTFGASIQIFVTSPFLAARTGVQAKNNTLASGSFRVDYAGSLRNTTSYTSFKLTNSASTMTGGEIRVYGFQNSQDEII